MAVSQASGGTGNLTDVQLRSFRVLNDGTIAMALCNPDGTSINSILNTTVSSTSVNALVVGANGATNPVFNVDASETNVATGVQIEGQAAGSGANIETLSSGTNENLTVDAKGTGTVGVNTVGTTSGLVTLGNSTSLAGAAVNGPLSATSASASALAVGLAGTTNPALKVDASTASSATGVLVKSAAAAAGVALSVISSGTNEALTIDSKGSGALTLNATGTGNIITGATLAPAANKGITATTGTGAFDFSAATGVFKTSTGVNTIGGNLVGGGGATTTDFSGSTGTFKTSTGINTLGGATNINSASATAFTVATAGAGLTNPAFQVDASTGSQAAGLKVTGAATGGTVAVVAVDSGAATNLSANAKGTGTMLIGNVSTGQISIGRGSVTSPLLSSTITALGTTQNSTPTAAQLLGGVVTQTGQTGAGTVTLPTGTQLSTAVTAVAVGDTFTTWFANLGGGQTLTVTGATGSTVIGTAAVPSAKNAEVLFVNTGANTWNVYVMVSA